jgi:hypothetical protein
LSLATKAVVKSRLPRLKWNDVLLDTSFLIALRADEYLEAAAERTPW